MNAPQPPDKTLADYLAILISPILIMALVGSLVFFCLEVAYRGENGGMIRWTLFWFVLAAVLVSRISIENGSNQGTVYGVLLGVVTGMMMTVYVDWVIGCWVLLALAWWFASKITWDCTVVDGDEDTSGEGLLDAAGFKESRAPGRGPGKDQRRLPKLGGVVPIEQENPIPIPLRASTAVFQRQEAGRAQGRTPPTRKPELSKQKPGDLPHSPGMWVIYFSLAALPIFGLGQHFISKADLAERNDAFVFVFVYVIAALGLLLSSSFLNLRRYLRQRSLRMPASMAAGWVGRGVVLAAAVAGLAILLPRPQATYSLTSMLDRFEKKEEVPAQTEDSSLPGVQKRSNRAGQGQDGRSDSDQQEAGAREAGSDQRNGGEGRRDGGREKSTQGQTQGMSVTPDASLGAWLKYLVYAALGVFAAWHLYRNRGPLWAALLEILRTWKNFLRKLMGWDVSSDSLVKPMIPTPIKAFESLENPFRTGAARHRSLDELARCTLEAVESWAEASQIHRDETQTPAEFLRGLGHLWPDIALSVEPFAEVYGRVAYGGELTTAGAEKAYGVMESLWRNLEGQRTG